jgi:hypothetical protein
MLLAMEIMDSTSGHVILKLWYPLCQILSMNFFSQVSVLCCHRCCPSSSHSYFGEEQVYNQIWSMDYWRAFYHNGSSYKFMGHNTTFSSLQQAAHAKIHNQVKYEQNLFLIFTLVISFFCQLEFYGWCLFMLLML